MRDHELDIVDLGTKMGNATIEFLQFSKRHLDQQNNKPLPSYLTREEFNSIDIRKCVGYERAEGEKYRAQVEGRKMQFRIADLATAGAIEELPPAKVYLAWHFLEHVPNKDWSRKLVHASLSSSRWMSWFRLPSFQQDDATGEGALREHGMRFTWTNWRGHPSHWLVEDCTAAITSWAMDNQDRPYHLSVRPAGYIRSMDDHRVVPIDTEIDVNKYQKKHGPKPLHVKLKQPIVAEWEVIVRFK
jgi:hypothetical protein|tara:strand:+ start:5203 stop:5934 length:732 start_codon:yes stop_codon:yes gene_type:complete